MKDRKPILILKLEFLFNGEQVITNIVKSPHMDNEMMLSIVEEFYLSLKEKYGKETK